MPIIFTHENCSWKVMLSTWAICTTEIKKHSDESETIARMHAIKMILE